MTQEFPILGRRAGAASPLDNELRVRLKRIACGDCRVDDLDRLFLGQRDAGRLAFVT